MGVVDGPKLLRLSQKLTDSLKDIRETVYQRFPKHGPHPIVGIDVSIFIVGAIRTKGALQELFMEPKVPVMSVTYYVRDFCLMLKRNNFQPILVFDGARNPLKKETNIKRYQHLEDDIKKLEEMYAEDNSNDNSNENVAGQLGSNNNDTENNSDSNVGESDDDGNKNANNNNDHYNNNYHRFILHDIIEQQKKSCLVREDVLFEVKAMAERENFRVVGSPFEADSQLIALINQGIIDCVLTNDSDIPFQGCSQTIMRLSKSDNSGPCCLVTRSDVLENFKRIFESERELNNTDLSLFACILGNDYIDRTPRQGLVSAKRKMKDWVKLQTDLEQEEWLATYVDNILLIIKATSAPSQKLGSAMRILVDILRKRNMIIRSERKL